MAAERYLLGAEPQSCRVNYDCAHPYRSYPYYLANQENYCRTAAQSCRSIVDNRQLPLDDWGILWLG